jgi:CHASE2 domain-containing sensor protein
MAAAASAVTWLALLRTRRSRTPWPGAVAALLLSLAVMLLVAVIGYGLVAAPHFLLGPFVPGAAALSGVTVLVTWAINPRRGSAHG